MPCATCSRPTRTRRGGTPRTDAPPAGSQGAGGLPRGPLQPLRFCATGLVQIIEPEADINSSTEAEAETLLRTAMMEQIGSLKPDEKIMLELTLPEEASFYAECIARPNVVLVVALSGGYSREEANRRRSENNGMIASFSRALSEGLNAKQSEADFDGMLDSSVASIVAASRT